MIKDLLKRLSPENRKRVTREQAGLYRSLDSRLEGKSSLAICVAFGRILAWIGFTLDISRKQLFNDVRASYDFFYKEYEKECEKNTKKLNKQCTPTDTY